MEEELRGAIAGMRVVCCTYRANPRRVHPLMIVVNDRGERVLHCWQIEGTSSSGRTMPCWGNFVIAGITDLEVEDATFPHTPRDYDPDRFRHVVCAVPVTPRR